MCGQPLFCYCILENKRTDVLYFILEVHHRTLFFNSAFQVCRVLKLSLCVAAMAPTGQKLAVVNFFHHIMNVKIFLAMSGHEFLHCHIFSSFDSLHSELHVG